MRHRESPALRKATLFLRELMEERAGTNELLLPTTDRLTAMSGVSRATMCKAVKHAREEGLISTVYGRGMFILKRPAPAAPHRAPPADKETRPAWELLRDRIDEDIRRGTFPPGAVLPAKKEFSIRHGTSYANVNRALTSLEQGKRIVRHKRGYRVFEFGSLRHRSTIVFIGMTDKKEILLMFSQHEPEFMRGLELQLDRANINFEIIGNFQLKGYRSKRITLEEIQNTHNVLGYIVNTQRLAPDDVRDLLALLRRTTSRSPFWTEELSRVPRRHCGAVGCSSQSGIGEEGVLVWMWESTC
jgi:DNA-binding transcriptional regulator YhcF (GntR family)